MEPFAKSSVGKLIFKITILEHFAKIQTMRLKPLIKMRKILWLTVLVLFSSCTYAPRSTSIDNTYNARQMAVGVGDQPKDSMTSTTVENEASSTTEQEPNPPVIENTPSVNQETGNSWPNSEQIEQLRQKKIAESEPVTPSRLETSSVKNYLTIGSTKKDVARIQGTPSSISKYGVLGEWWYYGTSVIKFQNERIDEWNNHGNLKVKIE